MKIRFKFGKLLFFTIIPTVVVSHNPVFSFWCDWAIELHWLNRGGGVNFYSVDKYKFL